MEVNIQSRAPFTSLLVIRCTNVSGLVHQTTLETVYPEIVKLVSTLVRYSHSLCIRGSDNGRHVGFSEIHLEKTISLAS